jgi:N-methylhydantoinase B
LKLPGGAGIGNPFKRAVNLVREDVVNELITSEQALSEYGVVLTAQGEVDIALTQANRFEAGGNEA